MMLLLRSSFRSSTIASSNRKAFAAFVIPEILWDNNRNNLQFVYRRNVATAASTSSQTTTPQILLYQYAICPFCNKAKALLEYAGVDYRAIEVNPLTKAEIKW
jgi:glutaredoxin-related protein